MARSLRPAEVAFLPGRDAGAAAEDGRFSEDRLDTAVERALEANVARLKELRE